MSLINKIIPVTIALDLTCSHQVQDIRHYHNQCIQLEKQAFIRIHSYTYNLKLYGGVGADAHFASKNTLLKRNTLHCYILLKRTVCFKLACYSLLFNTLYPSTHFASWNVFLLGTLCPPTPFASQNPFLLSTVCFSTPVAPQNTLLLNTLCSSAHCAPQNTLLLSTLCFKEHFTPRNTLLLRTLYSLAHFAPWNTLLPKIFAMP